MPSSEITHPSSLFLLTCELILFKHSTVPSLRLLRAVPLGHYLFPLLHTSGFLGTAPEDLCVCVHGTDCCIHLMPFPGYVSGSSWHHEQRQKMPPYVSSVRVLPNSCISPTKAITLNFQYEKVVFMTLSLWNQPCSPFRISGSLGWP